ncbi:hypothetical protein P344_06800 [Spiroplasma mirum ATCC 29335]|uniref:ECF transporter S component n=1 Tax=Spiroplasma mirum ATCC 29335 TaxID=838561 RepID=W0GQY3_9MOLU|nr:MULTISPECIES: hypothetical protein [Spiroplasma]AHF61508.1 hypothetical protein SMM_1139 [Spiroplasma mirum ATCC 29335]AHI58658.1 hypothetical protein P344_06800 [Spiroplasma mirum ATCC 29335]AKM53548.1 hypothetical protein SATRI_v1c12100 [Spiroplasma atrichopogonis]
MGLLASFSNISKILYSNKMAYFASAVVGALFLVYCVYNGLYFLINPKKYHGIRFTTKNIAYITMLSAVSATVTIIISVTVPITVFPPIRIAFEGLMVKISGFIFGPIVGLLSGVVTDMIVMLFVPSYVHVAYIIVIASFGFISGCVSSLNRAVGQRKWILFLLTNIFIIVFGTFASLMTWYSPVDTIELFAGLKTNKDVLVYIIVIGTGASLVIIWIIMFVYRYFDKNKQHYWDLVAVIMLAVINEYWVTTLISAWGDIAFLTVSQNKNSGTDGYGVTMISRLAMAPVKILFNSAIIYITYRAISPLIHKDTNEVLQDKVKVKPMLK